jgi:hypothetical protein
LAAERFLIPIIGQDQYDALLEEVEGFEFPADGDDAVPVESVELLRKCRAVIAPLGYMMDLPTIQTQITDAGLRSINTENMQAAHRWEYNEVKEALADSGGYAIDALLKFLFANADDYDLWTECEEYQEVSSLIFRTGADFNKYFKVHLPHRTWWEFRSLISEVEDFYINSAIGKEFYEQLKDMPDANDETMAAIVMIKKCVAHLTIVKAIEKKSVKISPLGFTIKSLGAYSEGVGYDDQQATGTELSMLYASCERSGDSYLLMLKEYLNATASESVFADYYSSDKYVAPSDEEPVSKNCGRKIFGL